MGFFDTESPETVDTATSTRAPATIAATATTTASTPRSTTSKSAQSDTLDLGPSEDTPTEVAQPEGTSTTTVADPPSPTVRISDEVNEATELPPGGNEPGKTDIPTESTPDNPVVDGIGTSSPLAGEAVTVEGTVTDSLGAGVQMLQSK